MSNHTNTNTSSNLNSVQIAGNLGKAPESRPEVGSNGLATFSLAHNRYVPGQEKPQTSWFRCVAWGKGAEKVMQLGKGERVLVTGRLESRSWQGKDGKTQSAVEIVVSNVQRIETIKKISDISSNPADTDQADVEVAAEQAEAEEEVEPTIVPF